VSMASRFAVLGVVSVGEVGLRWLVVVWVRVLSHNWVVA